MTDRDREDKLIGEANKSISDLARLMHRFAIRRVMIDGMEVEIDISRSDEINEGK